jgi:hypothetical protein
VVADNGFTGTVQVSVSGVPSGVTVPQSAFPLVFAAGGPNRQSAVFQFWASTGPAIDTVLDFTATSNADVVTAHPTMQVNTFSIDSDPDSRTMSKKGSTSYAFTVSPQNLFFGSLYFQVFGLPKGVTASFSPQTLNVSQIEATTTMNLTAKGAAPGTYTLTVSPYIYSQQATVTLRVQ